MSFNLYLLFAHLLILFLPTIVSVVGKYTDLSAKNVFVLGIFSAISALGVLILKEKQVLISIFVLILIYSSLSILMISRQFHLALLGVLLMILACGSYLLGVGYLAEFFALLFFVCLVVISVKHIVSYEKL